MKILAIILLWPALAWSAPLTLKFESATAVEVLRIIYGDILEESVIVTSAALEEPKKVTLELTGSKEKLREQAGHIADAALLDVQIKAGVVVIDKRKDSSAAKEIVVYRPRYRAVTYLVELLSPLFPKGAFSQRKGIDTDGIKPDANQEVTNGSALSKFDRDGDLVVFLGAADDVTKFHKIVDQVDIQTPEVLVKAVVFEVTTDHENRSALQLAASILGSKVGLRAGVASAGEYSAVISTASFTAVFDALSADRRYKIITSPTMRVRSGAQAKLTVGKEVPTIAGATMDRNGNAVQQVTYRPSGVILDLKPEVRESEIELAIGQQISDFVTTTTGVNNSPTLMKREVSTKVGLRPSDVIVLGGLDQTQDTTENRGLSFLPDWLSGNSSVKGRTEIMLMLSVERI